MESNKNNDEVTADIDENDVVTITNHKTGMVTWMPFEVYRQLREASPEFDKEFGQPAKRQDN